MNTVPMIITVPEPSPDDVERLKVALTAFGGELTIFKPFDLEVTPAWPEKLTPGLSAILSTMSYQVIALAAAYRLAGHDIARSAEAEQAFIIHRYLALWFVHGDDGWAMAAKAEIDEIAATARQAHAARHAAAEAKP